eukprot:scaffold80744_cov53-Attheya_sp.AAC.2
MALFSKSWIRRSDLLLSKIPLSLLTTSTGINSYFRTVRFHGVASSALTQFWRITKKGLLENDELTAAEVTAKESMVFCLDAQAQSRIRMVFH